MVLLLIPRAETVFTFHQKRKNCIKYMKVILYRLIVALYNVFRVLLIARN